MSRIRSTCRLCGTHFYPDDTKEKYCPECALDAEDFGIDPQGAYDDEWGDPLDDVQAREV